MYTLATALNYIRRAGSDPIAVILGELLNGRIRTSASSLRSIPLSSTVPTAGQVLTAESDGIGGVRWAPAAGSGGGVVVVSSVNGDSEYGGTRFERGGSAQSNVTVTFTNNMLDGSLEVARTDVAWNSVAGGGWAVGCGFVATDGNGGLLVGGPITGFSNGGKTLTMTPAGGGGGGPNNGQATVNVTCIFNINEGPLSNGDVVLDVRNKNVPNADTGLFVVDANGWTRADTTLSPGLLVMSISGGDHAFLLAHGTVGHAMTWMQVHLTGNASSLLGTLIDSASPSQGQYMRALSSGQNLVWGPSDLIISTKPVHDPQSVSAEQVLTLKSYNEQGDLRWEPATPATVDVGSGFVPEFVGSIAFDGPKDGTTVLISVPVTGISSTPGARYFFNYEVYFDVTGGADGAFQIGFEGFTIVSIAAGPSFSSLGGSCSFTKSVTGAHAGYGGSGVTGLGGQWGGTMYAAMVFTVPATDVGRATVIVRPRKITA